MTPRGDLTYDAALTHITQPRALRASTYIGLVGGRSSTRVLPRRRTIVRGAGKKRSRHRGAHEYAGEAYLMVDDLAKAEEHLTALQRIRLIPCEEYEDLKKTIAAYRQRTGK